MRAISSYAALPRFTETAFLFISLADARGSHGGGGKTHGKGGGSSSSSVCYNAEYV